MEDMLVYWRDSSQYCENVPSQWSGLWGILVSRGLVWIDGLGKGIEEVG